MTPMMFGHPPYPACQSDYNGKTHVILDVDTPKHYEDHFRAVCVTMGSVYRCLYGQYNLQ